MPNFEPLREWLKESSKLSKNGQHREALQLLDGVITKAQSENQTRWVQLASYHAWAISTFMGDLKLAKSYEKQALACAPEDPFALFTLAQLLLEDDEAGLAKDLAAKSYELVVNSSLPDHQYLLRVLTEKWPEICRRQV